MQSLKRAIRRGNAVIVYDGVTRRNEVERRRGSTKKERRHAVRNAEVSYKNIDEYEKF